MDQIRQYADLSIRRACGFGFLGIATAMVGVYTDIVLAVRLAATGVTLMGMVLLFKSLQAPHRSYKKTEVWILLDRRHGLPEARAQEVFGNILRDRYLWHATLVAVAALALWTLAVTLRLLGRAGAV